MTCTKKKVSVEVAVPDGATHYEALINRDGEYYIDWYKQADDGMYWWEGMCEDWVVVFVESCEEASIKPIEVIE